MRSCMFDSQMMPEHLLRNCVGSAAGRRLGMEILSVDPVERRVIVDRQTRLVFPS